jgi:hypothetical protein
MSDVSTRGENHLQNRTFKLVIFCVWDAAAGQRVTIHSRFPSGSKNVHCIQELLPFIDKTALHLIHIFNEFNQENTNERSEPIRPKGVPTRRKPSLYDRREYLRGASRVYATEGSTYEAQAEPIRPKGVPTRRKPSLYDRREYHATEGSIPRPQGVKNKKSPTFVRL